MKVSLADQYMRLVYDYDMDVEDALRDILAILEKVAPGAIQNEIDNIEEYMGEFE
jgi:hypothetical protein